MRWSKLVCVAMVATAMGATEALSAAGAQAAAPAGGSYVLTATSDSAAKGYAPTFTGNGYLGVRVPATGQGYAGGTVPAQSELAGFYAKPSKPQTISDVGPAAGQHPDVVDAAVRRRHPGLLQPAGHDERLAPVDRPAHRDRHHVGDVAGRRRSRRQADLPRASPTAPTSTSAWCS